MIERKLKKGDFSTLTELESYFKRMVTNAKEFYPRNTQIFDDAERVRKALSNYMTKTNPAYNGGNYSAVPTPLPASGVVDEVEEEDEDDATPAKTGRRKSQGNAKPAEKQPEVDEGDEDEDEDAEEDEDEEDEEEDDDAEGEEDDDEEASQSSKRAAIIIRRRGPGRPPKGVTPRKSKGRTSTPSRPDCEYEDVPYKGLTFQAAQEKIVEEMLRKREDEYVTLFQEPTTASVLITCATGPRRISSLLSIYLPVPSRTIIGSSRSPSQSKSSRNLSRESRDEMKPRVPASSRTGLRSRRALASFGRTLASTMKREVRFTS